MACTLSVYRRQLLSTGCALFVFAGAASALAFNPNDDTVDSTGNSIAKTHPQHSTTLAANDTAPLYAPGTVMPSVGYASQLNPVLPPVDPAVAARAQAIMAQQQQAAVSNPLAAPASGFIAPPPVMSNAPATPMPTGPAIASIPAATPATIGTAPASGMMAAASSPLPAQTAKPQLSDATRTILSHVPASMDAPKVQTGSVTMDRVSPDVKDVLGAKKQEETYESVGLSIKVSRPGLDTNFELNRAYTALMGGDTQTAIETYKNILSVQPRNEDALFGLAATYHRLGDIDHARPIYGMLLQVNPNHREGLNNFLVLVSDESPQDALPELQRLEERNPDFSPIPAQTAIVLDKLGYADASRDKMLRAIELAPDNMTYKYNFAVMLDRQGRPADAAQLYSALIDASLHGATVPASTEVMEKRLNYLATEMTEAHTAAVAQGN